VQCGDTVYNRNLVGGVQTKVKSAREYMRYWIQGMGNVAVAVAVDVSPYGGHSAIGGCSGIDAGMAPLQGNISDHLRCTVTGHLELVYYLI
jgi:hypothetical protein